jgi:Zn-finger nucleic acid-binding protein
MTMAPENRVTVPACPMCATPLQLGSHGTLDHWSCPRGHGLAMTLTESHERLQEDEIAQLWRLARSAPAGPLPSPFDGRPMARFHLGHDADEVPEGEPGDGEDLGAVELDVDVEHQFIWFDAGELDELPEDLPDEAPSAEVLAREAEIRERFGAEIGEALAARDDHELTERMYHRLARRPGLLAAVDRIGRGLTSY